MIFTGSCWDERLKSWDKFSKEIDDMFATVSYVVDSSLGTQIDTADEDLKSYYFKVEAAGFTKDELKIDIENRVITVKGTSKKLNRTINKYFTAPKMIEPSSVVATFVNGLLEIKIDKSDAPNKFNVNIQ